MTHLKVSRRAASLCLLGALAGYLVLSLALSLTGRLNGTPALTPHELAEREAVSYMQEQLVLPPAVSTAQDFTPIRNPLATGALAAAEAALALALALIIRDRRRHDRELGLALGPDETAPVITFGGRR
jgi:hypothetical protein